MMNWKNWNDLDSSKKKQYLKMMIENTLYEQISAIQQLPKDSKKQKEEKTNDAIEEFYDGNKEQYEISCIEEVIAILEEIKHNKISKDERTR